MSRQRSQSHSVCGGRGIAAGDLSLSGRRTFAEGARRVRLKYLIIVEGLNPPMKSSATIVHLCLLSLSSDLLAAKTPVCRCLFLKYCCISKYHQTRPLVVGCSKSPNPRLCFPSAWFENSILPFSFHPFSFIFKC